MFFISNTYSALKSTEPPCRYEEGAHPVGRADPVLRTFVRSDYRYIFENAAALVEAVIGKYNIGNEIRTAYLGKDSEALADACKALKEAEKKVEAFHKTFTAQWYRENKAEGMEVHDIRMGGLEARMRACRKRIEKYLDGKISSLPELETPRAEPRSGFNPNGIFINWEYISSACPF